MKNRVCLPICLLCFALVAPILAQTKTKPKAQPDESRGIIAEEFLKARPAKSGAAVRRARYRRAAAKPSAAPKTAGDNYAQLGLTIWRLRPAKTNDEVRIIVQDNESPDELTPERVESNTPMRLGDRIRLSFEAPRTGYLYVIDREQYADGSYGEPLLIFPTLRARGGDNRVAAGRIIEIPGQDDRPPYFRLKPLDRTDQIAESLTVIVTPHPLEDITIQEKALALSAEQLAAWEKAWGAAVERFELSGGAGKAWTRAEKEAGADGTRQLTQEDPGPQTIYRVAVKPDQPILVNVGLRYVRASARKGARQ